MAIYRMEEKSSLVAIRETSFVAESIKEDPDLRYILRAQPEVIEEGLFILSEEFSHWRDSGRSIDLLALDSRGRLVVIELKRTATADHAELQAIRYAAMVSVLTSEDIVEAHRAYLDNWRIQGDAGERIQQHLASTDFAEIYTETPRIILVSAGFSKELTTSALWLNDNGLDIKCIQLQLYRNNQELLLLESSQVVPVPGTEALLVQAQGKLNETRRRRAETGQRVPGGDAFLESIENSPEQFRAELKRLYQWAVRLEQDGLTELETNIAITRTTLGAVVPGDKVRLITVCNDSKGAGIWLSRSPLERLAPQQLLLIDELKASGSDTLREPSDELLDAFRAAYREANGLPDSAEAGE